MRSQGDRQVALARLYTKIKKDEKIRRGRR
jgi:hypothetical protein